MRVICVDDEKYALQSLVNRVKEALPEAEVHEFRNGEEAWLALQQAEYDMVFTDISMCKMGGVELAEKIHRTYPQIQIFFEAGDSMSELRMMGIPLERCLYKPVTCEDITEKIAEIGSLPPFEIRRPESEAAQEEENGGKKKQRRGLFFWLSKK